MEKLRILVADAHTDVSYALQVALRQTQTIAGEVYNDIASIDDLLDRTTNVQPDLLVIDWQFPHLTEEHLAEVRRRCPPMKIVVLSIHAEIRETALKSGVDAFVSKADGSEHLMNTIQALIANRKISPTG